MLSHEVMGVLCLGVLWVVALLVALAASQELRDLVRLRTLLRPLAAGESGIGMIEGVVAEGLGEGGALAVHRVVQVGRATDAGSVAFHDRAQVSEVQGGTVELAGARVRVLPELARASVWTRQAAKAFAARPPEDLDTLRAARESARTARGYARTVTTALARGERIFIAGDISREEGALIARAPRGGELLVAADDPRSFARRHITLVLGFIVGELVLCAAATRVATWPPVFGSVSIAGALGCIAFFLGVTPIGVAVRDACRPPSQARLRGSWSALRKED